MNRERITDKQGICLLIEFFIGSSLILGMGGTAKNDAWLAIISGIVMSIPMLLVYARLLSLHPGKDLFQILDVTMGKVLGIAVSVIYILYAFYLGALVFRNFGEFINIVALPETPMIIPLLFLALVCIMGARSGIEVLGRTVTFFIPLIFVILIFVTSLSIPQLKLNYLKPVLGNGLGPVLHGGFATFSFPFAESVLLICVFTALKSKKSPYRIYFIGLLIAAVTFVAVSVRNTALLGGLLGNYYFPSYTAVGIIQVDDFFQRIEVTVSFVFLFSVFVKSTVCLLAACKGIARVLRLSDYRSVVFHAGLLMAYFSYSLYQNSLEMREWSHMVYPYFAFPMQVILPVAVWTIAEIKLRLKNSRQRR
jgi:spore germination protein KB